MAVNPLLEQISKTLAGISASVGQLYNSSKPSTTTQTPSSSASIIQPKPSTPTASVSPARIPYSPSYTPQTTTAAAAKVPYAPTYTPPKTTPSAAVSPSALRPSPNETPAQTYQRVTGQTWTGGTSAPITSLLREAGITSAAGSADANLALQRYLNSRGSSPAPQPSQNNAPQAPQQEQPQQERPAPEPVNVTLEALLQDALNRSNKPVDYAAEMRNAQTAYQSVFGTPENRGAGMTQQTKAAYAEARQRAQEDLRGNLASRGLLASGELDKGNAENERNFARDESYDLAKILAPFQEAEQNSVLDIVSSVAQTRQQERDRVLSMIPNLTKGPDYAAGSIGEYQFYADQERAAGRAPMSFTEYQNADANRKRPITNISMGATGMSTAQTSNFLAISNKYQADSIIATGLKGATAVTIADQVIANPSNAGNQLKALYTLVKNLDPDSAVREGELQLAQQTQSYLQRFQTSLTRVDKGQVMSPQAAVELAAATKELASAWFQTAKRREQQYQSQATVAGVGDPFNQYLGGFERPFAGSNDPVALLEDDIRQLGSTYPNREALIAALRGAYPELSLDQIAAKVYTLIPDKK